MRRLLTLTALVFLLAGGVAAQNPLPAPKFQGLSGTGVPLVNGCVFTYISGTNTPQATYTDFTGVSPNTNPVILDGSGRADIWLGVGLTYRIQLVSAGGTNCSTGTQQWQVDGITGSSLTSALAALPNGGILYNKNGLMGAQSCFNWDDLNSILNDCGSMNFNGTGANLWFSSVVTPAMNSVIFIDGCTGVNTPTYVCTAAGIQAALNAAPAGGTVHVPLGTVQMGGTGLTIPSGVCLTGDGMYNTILRFTSPVSGGIFIPNGATNSCVENIGLSFSSATTASNAIETAIITTPVQYNTFRDISVTFDAVTITGTAAFFVPAGGTNEFSLNTIDNLVIQQAQEAVICNLCEGNYWNVDGSNLGSTVNSTTFFQEIGGADERLYLRLESGSANGTNDVCLSATSWGHIVHLTCDMNNTGTALNDTGGYSDFTVSLVPNLAGHLSLGTVATTSSYRVLDSKDSLIQAKFPNLISATLTANAITNSTGLELLNTSTTCTTGAAVGSTCTTAAITLPVAQPDTAYRIGCTGLTPTNVPVVQTISKTNTTFTITIAALTAAAATFASFDCTVGHN